MDTVTQAVLGAAIGEAGFRGRLGRRAVAFGAICGLLPDADVVTRVAGEWESLVYHRGATHSLLVLPFAAALVGAVAARALGDRARQATWIHLAFWALITHPLLDVFTSYGTQLLAPLSRARFSLDTVAIIDPVYTLPLLFATALAARKNGDRRFSQRFAAGALAFTTLYLGALWSVTQLAAQDARAALDRAGHDVAGVRTPPAMLFPPVRRVVARGEGGRLYLGAWSLFARDALTFTSLVSDDTARTRAALATEPGEIMVWFSGGFLWVQDAPDGVVLSDQRFGLFRDPTWTPFAAVARFDAAGRVTEVTRRGRGEVDVGAELAAGWARLWGRAPSAQHGREQQSLHDEAAEGRADGPGPARGPGGPPP